MIFIHGGLCMNILFVCTGNTCRSPMAEAILKDKFPEVNVRSAGVFAGEGQRANKHTIAALQDHKITLDHQSQSVTNRLLNWADIVLTIDRKSTRLNSSHVAI